MSVPPYHAVTAMLQSWSDLLMQGQFDQVAQRYVTPLALYVDGAPVVVGSPAELSQVFADLYAARKRRGAVTVKVQVNAMDLPRGLRQRVWARYIEYNAAGEQVHTTDCVQYLRIQSGETRSEMLAMAACDIVMKRQV